MPEHIFASFPDAQLAERAVGALMDHGIEADDIAFIAPQGGASPEGVAADHDIESVAKSGITTTTGGDAASGATKGGLVGAALGALAGLASLVIPGFGIVVGGGALATAIGAAIGTAAGGAVAGGVYGYLKDMGVPDEAATDYEDTIRNGGAMISVRTPADLDHATITDILEKYQARNVGAYGPGAGAPLGSEEPVADASVAEQAATAPMLGALSTEPVLADGSQAADLGDRWRSPDADSMSVADTDLGTRIEEAQQANRDAQPVELDLTGDEDEARSRTQPIVRDLGAPEHDTSQSLDRTYDEAAQTRPLAQHPLPPQETERSQYMQYRNPDEQNEEGQVRIPVVEEQIEIGKRPVETGGVRIDSNVVEKPVSEDVTLHQEHVNVERRPVDRPATEADFQALPQGTVEVREFAEEPVVDKQARVREEIVIDKDVEQHTERIDDTVRRTEVNVDELDARRRRL